MAGSGFFSTHIVGSLAAWLLIALVVMDGHPSASACKCLSSAARPDLCDVLGDADKILLEVQVISSIDAPDNISGNWLHTASVIEDYNGAGFQVGSSIMYSTYCSASPLSEPYLVYLDNDDNCDMLRIALESCSLFTPMSYLTVDELQALTDGTCTVDSTDDDDFGILIPAPTPWAKAPTPSTMFSSDTNP